MGNNTVGPVYKYMSGSGGGGALDNNKEAKNRRSLVSKGGWTLIDNGSRP